MRLPRFEDRKHLREAGERPLINLKSKQRRHGVHAEEETSPKSFERKPQLSRRGLAAKAGQRNLVSERCFSASAGLGVWKKYGVIPIES